MPKVIEVIESEICRGKGKEDDPIRNVTQYHTLDGEFLAERDQMAMILSENEQMKVLQDRCKR